LARNAYPPPGEPMPVIARNGFATAGFVLGLVGLVFSIVPFIGVIAWPLVVVGLTLAGIGFYRVVSKNAPGRGLAIAGLSLSLIGLAVCVIWVAGLTHVLNNPSEGIIDVRYSVTGTAHDVTITYSAFGDGGSATDQESASGLPWWKDVHISGRLKASSLTVTTGAAGGSVTCQVIVDGNQTRTSTATGRFAVASCNGF
jgi:hypothetical protein